ncbi:MAG TPA: family 10 glycosylhydrolase [Verrucomicrobiae bacterium]
MNRLALLILFLLWLPTAHGADTNTPSPPAAIPPKVDREFRAAWIAVVSNIDWPSKPGLSAEQQKTELRALIEKAAELRLNAILFQVRPGCDAVYRSIIEPWTEFLSGEMGKAPTPDWDPLDFAIRECHARGIELHAWFNPYRAGFIGTKNVSPKHIRKKQPKLVKTYGKYFWLDPGEIAVQDYTTRVILDVVRRYDVDGVHLDDYFYPYPEFGEFPDQVSWNRYRTAGGKMEKNDWRRENVNKLVRRLQTEIRKEKAWVTFGISPFGIWRPNFPPSVRGLDAYDQLYADSRLWLVKGWVDYLAPQLYWPSNAPEQSYPVLLAWWQQQSEMGRPVWPGGAITRAHKWGPQEILRQIEYTRQLPQPGYVHWNLSSLAGSTKVQRELKEEVYQTRALVPVNPGDAGPVSRPTASIENKGDQRLVRWSVPNGQMISGWIFQVKRGANWETRILPATMRGELISAKNLTAVSVTAISRFRNLSAPALIGAQ